MWRTRNVIRYIVLAFIIILGVVPVKASEPSDRASIFIDSNEDFTPANGVTAGTGTVSDPFIIEGWNVDSSGSVGITVRDTDAHFIVRNVRVHNGEVGIFFERVVNGRVENSSLIQNDDGHYPAPSGGIVITGSSRIVVSESNISNNSEGILIHASSDIVLHGNTISSNVRPGGEEEPSKGHGIVLSDSTKVHISRNNISFNALWGILSHDTTNITISSNQVKSNGGFGIFVGGRAIPSELLLVNLVITNNTVSSNGSEGIAIDHVSRAELSENVVISNGRQGMGLSFSSQVVVSGNRFASNAEAGLGLHISHASVSRNIFTGDGIGMAYEGNYDITPDNVLNGKPIYYHHHCYKVDIDGVPMGQLIVSNCRNVRVSRLAITNASLGIQFLQVSDAEIVDSSIAHGDLGIALTSSTNVIIRGNSLHSNWIGISLVGTGITISDNIFSSNLYAGIYTLYATDLVIADNRIADNGRGLVLGTNIYPTGSITVKENDFLNNGVGIVFHGMAQILRVYHNNLVENEVQALDFAYRSSRTDYRWDNSYPGGGNFWSDYAGVDNCSGASQDVCPNPDGIGDTPYTISEASESRDRYPLVTPFTIVIGTLDVDPDAISPRSSGKYLLAHLEFPDVFDISKINQSSIRLNGVLAPSLIRFGDHDRNGIPDVSLKFSLEEVKALFSLPGRYTIEITGRMTVGDRPFTASDTIRFLGFTLPHT